MRFFYALLLAVIFGLSSSIAAAESLELPKPGARDTCPVCGMFVTKYPEWVGTVFYNDGHAHYFDGAKDLFKYLHDLEKWAPGHKLENIESMGVTEYYDLAMIDVRSAFYVVGSDVIGPMGHELVPLRTLEDAEEFKTDHKGVAILRFDDVVASLPANLDKGIFK